STGANILTVGDNNASGNFGGTILSGNGSIAIVKIGAGTETLSGGPQTYTGNTTVSNGVLALSGPSTITSSPRITVVSPAVLDVSHLSSTFTLAAGQILAGNGIVTGAVALATGSKLDIGLSPGTLSFSNSLTMNGTTTATTPIGGVTNLFEL